MFRYVTIVKKFVLTFDIFMFKFDRFIVALLYIISNYIFFFLSVSSLSLYINGEYASPFIMARFLFLSLSICIVQLNVEFEVLPANVG